MMKNAVVTGATGQDGSIMIDYLLKNTDVQIIGAVRRISTKNTTNIRHLENNPRVELIDADITDFSNMCDVVSKYQPYYFFNFAANSFVKVSWKTPQHVWETNTQSIINQLEAIRKYSPTTRYYQAGSSEEFGNVLYSPQDEKHPARPQSPYGASKAAARQIVRVWRESYGLYAIQGWLFNHEGVRRGEEFVTRKISKGVAKIKKAIESNGLFDPIELGNLDAKRDWSDAEDFVDGVWRMLNQEKYRKIQPPDFPEEHDTNWYSRHLKEYVLASGETHSIREFVTEAFDVAGIEGYWHGKGLDEKYLSMSESITPLVIVNPNFFRPAEVNILLGNSDLAQKELGWKPKTNFKSLVKKMVKHDISLT